MPCYAFRCLRADRSSSPKWAANASTAGSETPVRPCTKRERVASSIPVALASAYRDSLEFNIACRSRSDGFMRAILGDALIIVKHHGDTLQCAIGSASSTAPVSFRTLRAPVVNGLAFLALPAVDLRRPLFGFCFVGQPFAQQIDRIENSLAESNEGNLTVPRPILDSSLRDAERSGRFFDRQGEPGDGGFRQRCACHSDVPEVTRRPKSSRRRSRSACSGPARGPSGPAATSRRRAARNPAGSITNS